MAQPRLWAVNSRGARKLSERFATSGAFPAGHIRGRHIQHPKPLSTSSRSGNHASPCKGSTQPDRRAHAPAIAADSLGKAFCGVFHLRPPSLPMLGDSATPQRRNSPSSFTKAAAAGIRESQDVPSHSCLRFWGDQRHSLHSPPQLLLSKDSIQDFACMGLGGGT